MVQMSDQPLIVIAEDDEQIANLVKFKLERSGYRVSTAENGRDALSLIREDSPDLVILDIMMPIMNGYEVLKNMKSSPDTSDIPVIMLTAKGLEEDILKGFESGAVDYVVKPFSVSELAARVKTNISKGG